ncbi:MAG TPA: TetR/AcrR family transcriptional regulator [Anaerovoracaceae bacterium]|nr:TetR/AcrR family transcriptional regulator [Anaerovoracaceae bacterium]
MMDKKAKILRCGKELFSSKGFKDTNIAEITKLAGMATGTFYNYYPSKDKLFMEIFIEENVKLKKNITKSLNLENSPLDVMKEISARNLQGMYANPILKEWYNKEVFNRLEQSFREEKGIEYVDFLYDDFTEIVKNWQSDGKMRNDIGADMIMAIFSCLVHVELHKDEIGLKYFPDVIEHLAEFTMKGLTDRPIKPAE